MIELVIPGIETNLVDQHGTSKEDVSQENNISGSNDEENGSDIVSTQNDVDDGIGNLPNPIDTLTYFPGLRRTSWNTAGILSQ